MDETENGLLLRDLLALPCARPLLNKELIAAHRASGADIAFSASVWLCGRPTMTALLRLPGNTFLKPSVIPADHAQSLERGRGAILLKRGRLDDGRLAESTIPPPRHGQLGHSDTKPGTITLLSWPLTAP
jgi:hypothetical protein